MIEPVYLDHAATTPLRREVRDAMSRTQSERWGNPSSLHRWGRESHATLEEARARLAAVLAADAREIVFTRGGTEADNLAVLGRVAAAPGRAVVCSTIEHRAVLAAAQAAARQGTPLHLLPADGTGTVRVDALEPLLRERPALVSVIWVNNETGAIQPIEALARRCAEADVPFHTDAVQGFAKLPLDLGQIPISMLSLTGHKIGGPRGTGALFVRRGVEIAPLLHGGGHERGLRPGTEDVAGAVGLATAAELWQQEREEATARLTELMDRLEGELRMRIPGLLINGDGAQRVPWILNISIPGANPELLLPSLDMEGIGVSSGSACASGAVTPSHVLLAMGRSPELAGPSLRLSLGRETTAVEVERALAVIPTLIARVRAMAPR